MATDLQRDTLRDVYTGLWVNRSYGLLHGATLTLDRQKGAFLIAFLALYVSTAGKSFWKLVRFSLHHAYSSTELPDGVYHQRQAILRNREYAPDAAWELLLASLAWRHRAVNGQRRLLPLALLALIITAGFAAAGLFSSRVTTSSVNEVLLSGTGCGIARDYEVPADAASILSDRGQKMTEYLTYARQCYQDDQAYLSEKCQTYTKPTLPYITNSKAGCPFSEEMCLNQSNNLYLDTGLLDGGADFGVNGGPPFQFRLTRHCAPLVTEGYTKLYNDTQNPSVQYMRYYYGRASISDTSMAQDDLYIYEVQLTSPSNASTAATVSRAHISDYRTGVTWSSPAVREVFMPVSQLNRADAQVSLIFLDASGIMYGAKIEDPWFSATTPTPIQPMDGFPVDQPYYIADKPASVLGCATQTLFCNPNLTNASASTCTSLATGASIVDLWSDEVERAQVYGVMAALTGLLAVHPDYFYKAPGTSLLASNTLMGPMQVEAIAADKWQKEIEYTFQASLASIQASLVETVRGSPLVLKEGNCQPQSACETLCHIQKMRSPRHYSFSVLGLMVIIIIGGIIMILGTFIESISSSIMSCTNRKSTYAQLEWQANSTLQLQRMVHEQLGLGTWSRTSESIPVTERRELLGVFDTSDPEHPRLAQPVSSTELDEFSAKVEWGVKGGKAAPSITEEAIPSVRSSGGTFRDRDASYENLVEYDRQHSMEPPYDPVHRLSANGWDSYRQTASSRPRYMRAPAEDDC